MAVLVVPGVHSVHGGGSLGHRYSHPGTGDRLSQRQTLWDPSVLSVLTRIHQLACLCSVVGPANADPARMKEQIN